MTTDSTECPPSSSYNVLVVRPRSACEMATGFSEETRKSRSSSDRSGLGTSRISSNDAAPRASQVHTCLPRYAGADRSTSHVSSWLEEIERIGGRSGGTGTRLRYGAGLLEDLLALDLAHLDGAVVDELLEVRAHRHLRRDHELAAELRSVDPACELLRRAAASPHLGQDLLLAIEPVDAVLLELAHGVDHRVPVARKQHSRLQRLQAFERVQIGGHITLRVRDHGAAAPEHEIARE